MTEAVSLGELLHEEALFGLTGIGKVGVPRGRLFPSGLCLSLDVSLGHQYTIYLSGGSVKK